MSTRANIIIQSKEDKLFFYRHCDGYPSETFEDLRKFVQGYKDGTYRLDVTQSAGWLVIHGHKNHDADCKWTSWRVGHYEPTTGLHGDIEFLYIIDLDERTLTCQAVHETHRF